MIRLLIVDDEPAVLSALQRALRLHFGERVRVSTQDNPLDALALARVKEFDIVLSDLRMPDTDGIAFLTLMAALQPHCVRLLLTGTADFSTAQRAISDAGVFRYLCKPWGDAELVAHVEAAILHLDQLKRLRATDPVESAQSLERARLEAEEPGITRVQWGPAGEVVMPPLADEGQQ